MSAHEIDLRVAALEADLSPDEAKVADAIGDELVGLGVEVVDVADLSLHVDSRGKLVAISRLGSVFDVVVLAIRRPDREARATKIQATEVRSRSRVVGRTAPFTVGDQADREVAQLEREVGELGEVKR